MQLKKERKWESVHYGPPCKVLQDQFWPTTPHYHLTNSGGSQKTGAQHRPGRESSPSGGKCLPPDRGWERHLEAQETEFRAVSSSGVHSSAGPEERSRWSLKVCSCFYTSMNSVPMKREDSNRWQLAGEPSVTQMPASKGARFGFLQIHKEKIESELIK